MSIERKLIPVSDPTDPNRCGGPGDRGEGQCSFLSVEGTVTKGPMSGRCAKHGGTSAITGQEKKRYHDFLLGKWQQRVDDFSASERITNLHGELGILRMQIEVIVAQCHSEQDLMLYSSKISDLTMKANTLVTSIDKIQSRSGNLLNKSAALVLAGKIVDIIAAEIHDPAKQERISNGIIDLVAKLAGKDLDDE